MSQLPTPWRAILVSLPVWMNIVAQWGGLWGLLTLMTQAPSYFRYVHGWGIRMVSIVICVPSQPAETQLRSSLEP